jgi:large subunit ribosomal protein L28
MRVCTLTGKRRNVANNVSHANNHTKKIQLPNVQSKRIFLPDREIWIRMRLSTRAIRNINRMGLQAYCGKIGLDYDSVVKRHIRA